MKKLITAIAAIATSFGLFADPVAFTNSVPSDIQSKTNNLVVGYDKDGVNNLANTPMPTVNWFADSLKTNFTEKIANYEQPELKETTDLDTNYKYLAIDTDVKDPVLRTFSAVAKDEGADNFKYNNIGISDHGVFIDTWTTFTLFDTDPEAPDDSKILVWAKETEADEEAGIVGATNLMVTCGIADQFGVVTPTNYVLDVSGVQGIGENGIQPETMYRLTIRADKEKNSDNTEFRVYLNTHQLSTVDGRAIFPSIKAQVQELGSAGFGGTGSLKSVDLLTEDDAPEKVDFAIDPTYLTVNWDAGVKSFTLAGETYNVSGLDYTSTNILITTTGETLTMTADFEELKKTHWWDSSIVVDFDQSEEDEDTPLASATFSVTRYAEGSEVTIVSQDDVTRGTLIVNGETIAGFSSLDMLLDKLEKIVCGDEYDVSKLQEYDGNVQIIIGADTHVDETFGVRLLDYENAVFTIDLAGYTITGETETVGDDFYVIQNYTTMTITDSVGGGAIIAGDGFEGSVYNGWNMTLDASADLSKPIIYDGSISNDISFDGVDEWCLIKGGLFSEKPDMTIDGVQLAPKLDWEEQTEGTYAGWWLVVPQGAVTLSLTAGEHNSISSSPAAGSLEPETEVTVTVTPDTGYQFVPVPDGWDKGENGTIVSNFIITANTAITAPNATEILVTSITFDVASTNLDVGESFTLQATVLPENALDKDLTWTTSAEGVATVEDGLVTAVAAGSATITATNATSGKFATCTVAVAMPTVDITVPAQTYWPEGVTDLKIYQSADAGQTWTKVTDGKVIVGNQWKVEATVAEGKTVDNPIDSGTAVAGASIAISAEQIAGKIGIKTFTVTVLELMNFTVAVTNGETEVGTTNGVYTFDYATNVKVAFTAVTGYEIKTDTSTNIASLVENVVIAPPTVAAIPVPLTVTKGTGVESVTYTVNGDTPDETVKIGDVIKITDVTYETGYEAVGTYVKDYEYTVVAADVTAGSIAWTVLAKKQTFTVTVPAAPEHTTVEVKTNNEVAAYAASYTLDYGTKVDVAYTVIDPGYTITANASTNIASLVENVVVVAPTVAAIEYTLTLTGGENVTTNIEPDQATYTYGAKVAITATPKANFTYAGVTMTDGWATNELGAATNTVTITGNATVAIPNAVAAQTDPTPVDPSQGTIVSDGKGNFVITPAGSEITVQNAGANKFIVDVETDFTIKGVAAANITVKCNGEDITSVCKRGDAEGFSTELDPDKTTPELIEASATEQPLVVGTTVDLKIKQSVPGLAYKLLRVGEVGDFSDSEKITKVATMKGDGETLTLTDANKPANKAFYKVAVGKDVINESAD